MTRRRLALLGSLIVLIVAGIGLTVALREHSREAAEEKREQAEEKLEKIGVDIALFAEAYSYDAVSQLGYLAARTDTIELGSSTLVITIEAPPKAG